MRVVRREVAQLETALRMRQLAEDAAIAQAEVASALAGKTWQATTRFSYEDSAWRVEFVDEDGNDLASALVDLNKKRVRSRSARAKKQQPNLVTSVEIAG
jgi:hypothetical protein